MTEAPRHLIRQPGGLIRVLRCVVHAGTVRLLRYSAYPGPGMCAQCGCTDRWGCLGGCGWANASKTTICTRCEERIGR